VELGQLSNLQILSLKDNPLLTPPPEIVGQGTTVILSFYKNLRGNPPNDLKQKLILVGEGGQENPLSCKPLHGKQFQDTSNTTHGIEVDTLPLPHPTLAPQAISSIPGLWRPGYLSGNPPVLSDQTFLYLVVWNARIEASQSNLDYWLKTIHILAPDAPSCSLPHILINENQTREQHIVKRTHKSLILSMSAAKVEKELTI